MSDEVPPADYWAHVQRRGRELGEYDRGWVQRGDQPARRVIDGRAVEPDLEDVLADAYPRCPHCGRELQPAGSDARPVWECPDDGYVSLAE